MNISFDDIRELSSEEIYEKLLNLFDGFFYTNNFYQLSYLDYKKIVIEAIENSKNEYTGQIDYVLYLKKRIMNVIKQEEKLQNTNSLNEYIKDIDKIIPITEDEENELLLKASNGDKNAKDIIIEHYLKFVIYIARRYDNRLLSFEDLIQEGNFGLIKAIERFDPSKGYRFSTYAGWWIKQYISRAIADKGSLIRLPVHMYEKYNKVKKASNILEQQLKRRPTIKEIADYTNLSEKIVITVFNNGLELQSLDEVFSDDCNFDLEDVIPNKEDSVEDTVVLSVLKDDINKIFNSNLLTEREKEILKLRKGFYDNTQYALADISKIYNISGERVRQIEEDALRKIRKSSIAYEFLDYMDNPQKAFNYINKISERLNGKSGLTKKRNLVEATFNEEYGIVERKKLKTVYSYFNKYSRAKINVAIGRLDLIDQFFIYYRYGGRLDIPAPFTLTMNQKRYFENNLIPNLSSILKKINVEQNKDSSKDIQLSDELFTSEDLYKMRTLLDKYKKSGISYYISLNQFFVKILNEGYINNKIFSKEDIMSILHLDSMEYDYYMNIEKDINEDKKLRENILKKLKKI